MGANMEVFKFSVYLGIPLFAMLHFGDPDWYEHHVHPYKHKLWPVPYEKTNKPPRTQAELQAEIERLRNERMGRRDVASAAAPESSVLASVQESRGQDWAAGEKRLV